MTDDVAELARKLTKGGRRALVRIGEEWTREGSPGPRREDAYSLWWGKCYPLQLIEAPKWREPGRWHYRLSERGKVVRAYLEQNG